MAAREAFNFFSWMLKKMLFVIGYLLFEAGPWSPASGI